MRPTVEPIVLLGALGQSASAPLFTQLFLWKTCRQQLHLPDRVCANLSHFPTDAQRVQAEWAQWNAAALLVAVAPALLFSVVVSAWSDRYGRRRAMQLPLVGALAASLLLLVNWWQPNLPVWQLLLVPLCQSFGGGAPTLLTVAMAWQADRGSAENLLMRFSIIEGAMLLGSSLGFLLGSSMPMRAAFAMYLVASVGGLCIVQWWVEETIDSTHVEWRVKAKAFISSEALVDFWRVLARWEESEADSTATRSMGSRGRLWLLLAGGGTLFLVVGGETAIQQPYMELPPFNWSLRYLMRVMSIFTLGDVLVLVLIVPALTRLGDVAIGLVGVLSQMSMSVVIFYTRHSSTFILVAYALGQLNPMAPVAVRALVSRCVRADEQARALALLALLEATLPSVGGLLFAALLSTASKTTWPASMPFGVAALLCVVPLGALLKVDLGLRRGGSPLLVP